MKNKKFKTAKGKRINLKEIDESIRKTEEETDKLEDEIIELHKKIIALL
jgi:hypothetical protein